MGNFVSVVCALDYIENSLPTRITVGDVAQAAFISVSHLQSLFRRVLHVSVGEYIAKRQLCLAAKALINTEDSITEIAFDCGYSNVESFTRAFKRQFLLAPSVYRKSYRFSQLYPPMTIITKDGVSVVKKFDLAEISENILGSKGTFVLCADIDGMIEINTKFGYAAGDAAIAETAARIGRSITEGMKCFRVGADSFAVLTNSGDVQVGEAIAQKIISCAGDKVKWNGGEFTFSLSIGIVKIPQDITDAKETLQRTDKALAAAKTAGKNCYKVV